MKTNPLVRFTKHLIDFMLLSGVVICLSVPMLFRQAAKYFSIFQKYYVPYCIVFMAAGVFALIILWNLRNMFQTVINENPFVTENVISLKRMGSCAFMIAILLLVKLVLVLTPAAAVLVLVFIIAGLFSLVLSQVFEQAVSYKQENDLTI
ncbi:DUF2975 domain-containing protein [Anaeromicropila populeti]|uniref:DUF2975 domain-containing protein n=1 Tax=Anaeromicropila populeti TaxID=37658 RepID=A0A1I6JSE4_9FIRM|nr:DUF2975 domain-containing protein [Anaeromicropila populeti]SFR81885.1 Protein of unknown function [Anaeromicropila populeti]